MAQSPRDQLELLEKQIGILSIRKTRPLYHQLPPLMEDIEIVLDNPSIYHTNDPQTIADYARNQYIAYGVILTGTYAKLNWTAPGPRISPIHESMSSTLLRFIKTDQEAISLSALRLLEKIYVEKDLEKATSDEVYEYADACYLFALDYLVDDPPNISYLFFTGLLQLSRRRYMQLQHRIVALLKYEWFAPIHIISDPEPEGFLPFQSGLFHNYHAESHKTCAHCGKLHQGG
jgi:hypothetical protein